MKINLNRLFIALSLFAAFGSAALIYSACCGNAQRTVGDCPNENCRWERFGGRCNADSECCPGKQCSALGYCEACD